MLFFFFFKQKTAYEMRISDWSSDVCSSDLSIIGFDDSPTATHIWPALSTVRWPIRDMGIRAAQTLAPDFLGPGAKAAGDESNVLASTFIERQSVASDRKSVV